VAVVVAALGAWGCAYFNTFYNAKRIYREAEATPRARDGTASAATRDKYEKVIEKCESLIASYPKSKHVDDAILLIGKCLYETGDYGGAIGQLSVLDTLSTDPKVKTEAWLYIAKSYIATDESESAIPYLERIVEKNPKKASDETLFYLGTALVKSGDEEQAVKYLEQLAFNYPRSNFRIMADLEVAEVYAERGEYDKSLAVYDRLRGLTLDEPEKIRMLTNLGKVYTDKGEYEKAIAVFHELDQYVVEPTLKAAYLLDKGRAYAGADSIPVAIDTYKTVAASYPRSMFSAEAHYRLGGIYQNKLDSLSLAQQEFDKVAGEYAGSPYASEAISSSSAISKLLRLRESIAAGGQGDQASVEFDLAEIELFQFKDREKALAGYRKVVDGFPTSDLAPRAAYAIAYIYDTPPADTTKAVEAYEFVTNRYPYTQQGEYARRALARLGHPVPEPPPRPAEETKTVASQHAATDTTAVHTPQAASDTTGVKTPLAVSDTTAVKRPAEANDTTNTAGKSAAPSDTTSTSGRSRAASDTTSSAGQSKSAADTTNTGGKESAASDSTGAGGESKAASDTTSTEGTPKPRDSQSAGEKP
jgi:tetratricopeptide (TPR) repeat protein